MRQLSLLIVFLIIVLQAHSQKKETIDSLNNILIQNASISSDSLQTLYSKNLADAQQINYQKGIADSYKQLATLYGYRAEYEKSTDFMLKAIRAYEKNNLKEEAAYAYGELGYGMKRGDMKKAQYYMNKGLDMATAGDMKLVLSKLYNNYGVLKEMQEQLDSAIYFYQEGLAMVQEIDYAEGLPYAYSNLGGVFGLKGDFAKARDYFNRSLQARMKIQDNKGIAENYTQLGEVYLSEKKFQNAIKLFKKSIPVAEKEDYRFLIQYNYQKLSESYKATQNTDSALYFYEKYDSYRDSISNLEIEKKLTELNIEFETERKENQLLKANNDIFLKDETIRRKNWIIGAVLGSAVLAGVVAYLIYYQQKLRRKQLLQEKELEIALAKIETQNKLEEQRLRISRDLHDNIGSQLSFITSGLDNLAHKTKDSQPDFSARIDGIRVFTGQTINELRDTIWAMNKENISLEELRERLVNFLNNARKMNSKFEYYLRMDPEISPDLMLTSLEGINIFRIIQEAVNNATKYSEGKNISVFIHKKKGRIVFQVSDDGSGLKEMNFKKSHGIRNMQKRAQNIQADFEILSNGSTIIQVSKSQEKLASL